MRILQLRFKNLNSLYGEWKIDFTNPVYQHDGIFAIIGPTGSGKSTILDAICLALYGRTPRLSKVNKSSNEIMSRHTGECFSEVTFSTAKGNFRAFWCQHRARKNPTASLVDYKHELADADKNRLIETKRSLTYKVIEEKTGMDFDRFTRSILLAQGSFDTFLKADSDQRSPILEKITGTSIYSDISKKVHERKNEELKKLEILETELGSITFFTEEEEAEELKSLEEKQNKEKGLSEARKLIGEKSNWLEKLTSLRKELEQIDAESESLKEELQAFSADKIRLQKAQKAVELEPAYTALQEKRKLLRINSEQQRETDEQLPLKQKQLAKALATQQRSEKNLHDKREEQKQNVPRIKQVRALDLLIEEKKILLKEESTKYENFHLELKAVEKDLDKLADQKEQQKKQLETVKIYLDENGKDEILLSEFATISYKLEQLTSIKDQGWQFRNKLTKVEEEIKKQTHQLEVLTKIRDTQQKKINKVQQRIKAESDKLSKLLADRLKREYQAEVETLQNEIMYLRKISDLEDERARLVKGKPCPLCGSQDHPFSTVDIPQKDEKEVRLQNIKNLVTEIETVEKQVELSRQEESSELLKLGTDEKVLSENRIQLDGLAKEAEQLENELKAKKEAFEHLQKDVSQFLAPLGINFSAREIDQLLATLKKRKNLFSDKQKELEDGEKKLTDLLAEEKSKTALAEKARLQCSAQQETLLKVRTLQEKLHNERVEIFGDKDVDNFEEKLEKEVQSFERTVKEDQEQYSLTDKELSELQALLKKLHHDIEKIAEAITIEQNAFFKKCQAFDFNDEKHYLDALLPSQERLLLEGKEKAFLSKKAGLEARRDDCREKLSRESAKQLTEKTRDELLEEEKVTQLDLKELGEQRGAIKQQLEENKAAKEKMNLKIAAISGQKKEFAQWQKLHGLIGSNDGKKYRNFAQGLTFELMVQHANLQLAKMSDRYLLTRDSNNPLELNVIDNYQAGEERSTKNLSGGESFIISLALALGLSNMASRQIRVDSLFLDEGFGTLDEEALETALTTLSSLQQDDKLIGVISHVSALQERIINQIQIEPTVGGRSIIVGTGAQTDGSN